jgi:hypothetical protein
MPLVVAILIAAVMALPAQAGAATEKHLDKDGSVPAKWNLKKPAPKAHADEAPETAGGDGTGYNSLSFGSFENGDMIVALGTATGHAGEWDDYYYYTAASKCVWSANTVPVNGVQLEAASKYRTYDYAYGIWVPSLPLYKRVSARNYCRVQKGEPYNILSSKSDQSRWYCSKLCWSSYRYTASIDLDADGGYWVWPIDLLNDSQTAVFVRAI